MLLHQPLDSEVEPPVGIEVLALGDIVHLGPHFEVDPVGDAESQLGEVAELGAIRPTAGIGEAPNLLDEGG